MSNALKKVLFFGGIAGALMAGAALFVADKAISAARKQAL